jgi:hypothetical protein
MKRQLTVLRILTQELQHMGTVGTYWISWGEKEKLIFGNGRMMTECDFEHLRYPHTCALEGSYLWNKMEHMFWLDDLCISNYNRLLLFTCLKIWTSANIATSLEPKYANFFLSIMYLAHCMLHMVPEWGCKTQGIFLFMVYWTTSLAQNIQYNTTLWLATNKM